MITDNKVDPQSYLSRKPIMLGLAIAQSITSRCFFKYTPGFFFQVKRLQAFLAAYTATLGITAFLLDGDGSVVAGALAINATAEKWQVALSRYVVGGAFIEVAAANAQLFSTNHTIAGANKYGAFLVQVSSAGAYSTKDVGTGQAYATAAAAIAAMPAADAGKVAVGYIVIQAKNATWTANTDDLTNGSDCVTAVFVTYPVDARAVAPSFAPIAGKEVPAILSTTRTNVRGRDTDTVYLCYTSDGTAVVTNLHVELELSALPLAGQVG